MHAIAWSSRVDNMATSVVARVVTKSRGTVCPKCGSFASLDKVTGWCNTCTRPPVDYGNCLSCDEPMTYNGRFCNRSDLCLKRRRRFSRLKNEYGLPEEDAAAQAASYMPRGTGNRADNPVIELNASDWIFVPSDGVL